MKKVILFGSGGYSDNIRIILKGQRKIAGYLDENRTGMYHGVKIFGSKVEDVPDFQKYCYFVCIGDIESRKRIFESLHEKGLEIINVVSKQAYVSEDVKMGVGNYIAPGVKIMADVKIGDDNYIGTSAIVEHGSRIGSHCRITSNATLNGETIVRDEVFFGSGAICNGCLEIGRRSVVGSGSVVLKDVTEDVTVVGVPAKVIKKNKKDRLVILGAGQQGRNCKRLAEVLGVDVVAFVDDYEADFVEGIKVYRRIEDIKDFEKMKYIVAVGDIDVRKKFIGEIKRFCLECMNLIDPSAKIEKGAKLGTGNYVYKLVSIYRSATVGDHNIINTGVTLATDSVVGDNCNLEFGCNVCGDCHVGDNSVIGYNASIASGYNVGKNVFVEANSVVYRNVEDGEYVKGVVKDEE